MKDLLLVDGKYYVYEEDLNEIKDLLDEINRLRKINNIKNKLKDKYKEIIKEYSDAKLEADLINSGANPNG
jgi:hypothetical protein